MYIHKQRYNFYTDKITQSRQGGFFMPITSERQRFIFVFSRRPKFQKVTPLRQWYNNESKQGFVINSY